MYHATHTYLLVVMVKCFLLIIFFAIFNFEDNEELSRVGGTQEKVFKGKVLWIMLKVGRFYVLISPRSLRTRFDLTGAEILLLEAWQPSLTPASRRGRQSEVRVETTREGGLTDILTDMTQPGLEPGHPPHRGGLAGCR